MQACTPWNKLHRCRGAEMWLSCLWPHQMMVSHLIHSHRHSCRWHSGSSGFYPCPSRLHCSASLTLHYTPLVFVLPHRIGLASIPSSCHFKLVHSFSKSFPTHVLQMSEPLQNLPIHSISYLLSHINSAPRFLIPPSIHPGHCTHTPKHFISLAFTVSLIYLHTLRLLSTMLILVTHMVKNFLIVQSLRIIWAAPM